MPKTHSLQKQKVLSDYSKARAQRVEQWLRYYTMVELTNFAEVHFDCCTVEDPDEGNLVQMAEEA